MKFRGIIVQKQKHDHLQTVRLRAAEIFAFDSDVSSITSSPSGSGFYVRTITGGAPGSGGGRPAEGEQKNKTKHVDTKNAAGSPACSH